LEQPILIPILSGIPIPMGEAILIPILSAIGMIQEMLTQKVQEIPTRMAEGKSILLVLAVRAQLPAVPDGRQARTNWRVTSLQLARHLTHCCNESIRPIPEKTDALIKETCDGGR
jgi:hypothetical protein